MIVDYVICSALPVPFSDPERESIKVDLIKIDIFDHSDNVLTKSPNKYGSMRVLEMHHIVYMVNNIVFSDQFTVYK